MRRGRAEDKQGRERGKPEAGSTCREEGERSRGGEDERGGGGHM